MGISLRCGAWMDSNRRCPETAPCQHHDENHAMLRLAHARADEEFLALKDRASTSYREGYEAGRAYEREVLAAKAAQHIMHGRDILSGAPVLASNPLDPKCASIFEAAEILASVTACMSNLAKALEEMSEKAEVTEKRRRDLEEALELIRAGRDHYRNAAWEADAGLTSAREHLRLITKERDEWERVANDWQRRRDDALQREHERASQHLDAVETAQALKRQLGETQEALGKATERAERAEAMLTTERRS